MVKKKKLTWLGIAIVLLLAALSFGGYYAWKYYFLPDVAHQHGNSRFIPAMPDRKNYESLEKRADAAYAFAESRHMNTHYALFVDYGVASGTPRLYVWDFRRQCIISRTYVMHGPGMGSTAEKPVFSNKPGSNCSALGRFIVTKLHGNRQKKGFRLKGIDIDNQSALARGLMIHSSLWVDMNCWMKHIPLNSKACKGCVTVSHKGMDYICQLVNSEEKPLLLWNYCSGIPDCLRDSKLQGLEERVPVTSARDKSTGKHKKMFA